MIVLFLIGNSIISKLSVDEEIVQYLSEYFFTVVANITLIVSNIVGSIIFADLWDIKGIAIASVLSRVLFILIICLHLLSKKNTLRS